MTTYETIEELLTKINSLELTEEEKNLIGQSLKFMKYMADFKHSTGPFICGTSGKRDSGGLHDGYSICAAYGSDYVEHYKRPK